MKLNQKLVVRAVFTSHEDAEYACEELGDLGVFGYAHGNHVVFTDTTLNLAKQTLRRFPLRPGAAMVFDPAENPPEGWPEFKQISF